MVQTRRWSRLGKSLQPTVVVGLIFLFSPQVLAGGKLLQVSTDTV